MKKRITTVLVGVLSLAALAACNKPTPSETPSVDNRPSWEKVNLDDNSELRDFVAGLPLPEVPEGETEAHRVLTEEELAALEPLLFTNDRVVNSVTKTDLTNWYKGYGSADSPDNAVTWEEATTTYKRFGHDAVKVDGTSYSYELWYETVEVPAPSDASDQTPTTEVVEHKDEANSKTDALIRAFDHEGAETLGTFEKTESEVLGDTVTLEPFTEDLYLGNFNLGTEAMVQATRANNNDNYEYVKTNWYDAELAAGTMLDLKGKGAVLFNDGTLQFQEGFTLTGELAFDPDTGDYLGAYPGFTGGFTLFVEDGVITAFESYLGYNRHIHQRDAEDNPLVPDPVNTYEFPWAYTNYYNFVNTNREVDTFGFYTLIELAVDDTLTTFDLTDWDIANFEVVE